MKRALLCIVLLLAACDDMTVQPKQKAERPVPTPAPPTETVMFRARPQPPPPVSLALLERGQDRFRVDCTPCHSELGDGHGMIVQRGFPPPPSFHDDRLRQMPVGEMVGVIANGYGTMYGFADRLTPADQWAIVAYIRALQHSQSTSLAALPADRRQAPP